MPDKPTLFVVTDIETTLRHRIAFDVAWRTIDRRGRLYDKGSYLIRETFALDIPYFKHKIGDYMVDAYNHDVQPTSMARIRDHYNDKILEFKNAGHRVIFAAYNAGFDARYLGETCRRFLDASFLGVPIWLVDIWDSWCQSAPLAYNYATEKGNPKTSAEVVFRYEMNQPDFVERHIAWSDVTIEEQILLKVLARKKQLPIVSSPSDFNGQPWRRLLNYPAYNGGKTIVVPA